MNTIIIFAGRRYSLVRTDLKGISGDSLRRYSRHRGSIPSEMFSHPEATALQVYETHEGELIAMAVGQGSELPNIFYLLEDFIRTPLN